MVNTIWGIIADVSGDNWAKIVGIDAIFFGAYGIMFWRLWAYITSKKNGVTNKQVDKMESNLVKNIDECKKRMDDHEIEFREHKKVVQYQKNCQPVVERLIEKIEGVGTLVKTQLDAHDKESKANIRHFNGRIDDLHKLIKSQPPRPGSL